jgi:hypothetical protein
MEGRGVEEIAVDLTGAFEVDIETAVADVGAVVRQFEELGLFETVG